MARTAARDYATVLVKSLHKRSKTLQNIDNRLVKGVIREEFVDELLRQEGVSRENPEMDFDVSVKSR